MTIQQLYDIALEEGALNYDLYVENDNKVVKESDLTISHSNYKIFLS